MPEQLRQASWRDVTALLDERSAVRNARGWADRFGVTGAWIGTRNEVTLESWSHAEIGDLMDEMSKVEPRMTVDMVSGVNNAALPPRLDGMPLVLVRYGDRIGMIDGKHRANKWRGIPGSYAALVIHA